MELAEVDLVFRSGYARVLIRESDGSGVKRYWKAENNIDAPSFDVMRTVIPNGVVFEVWYDNEGGVIRKTKRLVTEEQYQGMVNQLKNEQ